MQENKVKELTNHNLTDHHKHVAVIDILGQRAHIPINKSLVAVIIVLVVGLVAIEYISHGVSDTIKYVAVGGYSDISEAGNSDSNVTPARIYQFWTPGENTWGDVVASCGKKQKCLSELNKWKKTYITTKKELKDFGESLKKELNIPGYSRFPVIGAGGGPEKSGWYWKIILTDGNELDKVKLFSQYNKFFSRENIRIEEDYIGAPN